MTKSYLVVENSFFTQMVFLLKDSLLIGTGGDCDIKLADKSAGVFHTRVVRQDGEVYVDDLGASSGTFLNDRRIHEKTVMWEGDHLRCGKVVFTLLNDLVIEPGYNMDDSINPPAAEYVSLHKVRPSLNIRRLEELIPRIPLFNGISQDAVSQLLHNARLLFYDPEQIVFHQGDSGKSIFVILDGHVEIFFHDHVGTKTHVTGLKENQFFGEVAFLTGNPRNSTVRAVEVSYLCELQPKSLRGLISKYPAVKRTILTYYNQRVGDLAKIKQKVGFSESREALRYNLTLPVMIELHSPPCENEHSCGQVYRLLTKDLSLTGLSARFKENRDLSIAKVPVGHQLKVTLTLPPPFGPIEVRGVVARIEFNESEKQRQFGSVGIKFVGMTDQQQEKLKALFQR